MKGKIVNADGETWEGVLPKNGKNFQLKELETLIGGDIDIEGFYSHEESDELYVVFDAKKGLQGNKLICSKSMI
jgi:hypothetical protein